MGVVMDKYNIIKSQIEKQLKMKRNKFIIYPYGYNGYLTKEILNKSFGIIEVSIVDNYLSEYNSDIINVKELYKTDSDIYVLLTCEKDELKLKLKGMIRDVFKEENIIEIFKKTV